MLFKFCPRCKNKIEYGKKYCSDCEIEVEQQQYEKYKEFIRVRNKMSNPKERYKKYAYHRNDGEFQAFYNSGQWRKMRNHILMVYKYVDVYEYYKNNNIVPATMVHHVVAIKSNYNLRLEELNLIPLSEVTHRYIHEQIDAGYEEQVINELNEMIKRYRTEVLCL